MPLVDGIGCWAWVPPHARLAHPAPAVFLDRDGVIIEDSGYLSDASGVRLMHGAAEAIALLNEARIPVVVVTNQSGVARGRYAWRDFEEVLEAMMTALVEAADARLDGVFACGYHETGVGALGVRGHPWRKPNPGMLFAAADRLGLLLASSWVVGDRGEDLAAGRTAGLAGGTLIARSSPAEAATSLRTQGFRVRAATSLLEAVRTIDTMVRLPPC